MLRLISDAFEDGGPLPRKHACEGEDLSPPLRWEGVPEGVKEFALIMEKSETLIAPRHWVQWIIYGIPGACRELPEAIEQKAELKRPPGALQGVNIWNSIGYAGPAEPAGRGIHRYQFTLFALDATLDLEPKLGEPALLAAIADHIAAKASLTGTYER
jgi:Raf kinase inhibitor-like YbhB/YbcL family protein